jgi:hypothetical protein
MLGPVAVSFARDLSECCTTECEDETTSGRCAPDCSDYLCCPRVSPASMDGLDLLDVIQIPQFVVVEATTDRPSSPTDDILHVPKLL